MSVGLQNCLYVVHEAGRRELNLDQTQQMIVLCFHMEGLGSAVKMDGLSVVLF